MQVDVKSHCESLSKSEVPWVFLRLSSGFSNVFFLGFSIFSYESNVFLMFSMVFLGFLMVF